MRVKAAIPTFMIEFNKASYLASDEKTQGNDIENINEVLNELYRKLLKI